MIRVTKKIWLFGVPAILLIGLAVMTVLFFRQRKTIAEQQRVIDAQTESAYRALSNDLNDLNVSLSKLEAAATPARLSKTFADVRRLSAGAVRALSLLPVSHADDEGLMQFLAAHLKWPSHQESDCFGRVEVSFVVETDGSVSNVKIEKDPCGKFGDEVTRVISKMPRWNPGRQDGKVVRVLYKLPINFSLK